MRIERIIGTTIERIKNKEHNIYLGISLGNYYFTKERIYDYILWINEHSKEPPIIMIGDFIHEYNLEALSGYDTQKAKKTSSIQSSEKKNEVQKILNRMYYNEGIARAGLIDIVLLSELNTDFEKNISTLIYEEYDSNTNFKNAINDIVKQSLSSNKRFNELQHTSTLMNKLSRYVIEEMPFFLFGMNYHGKLYDLVPYPGIILDSFVNDIQNKRIFPELADKLGITKETASIDAYVD